MGNIEPAGIFEIGTPEQVKQAIWSLLAKMENFPNYVRSWGCDIPPGAPLKNIDAFFEALAEHSARN
jgi:uroporphyrinogen decarboxylase